MNIARILNPIKDTCILSFDQKYIKNCDRNSELVNLQRHILRISVTVPLNSLQTESLIIIN